MCNNKLDINQSLSIDIKKRKENNKENIKEVEENATNSNNN